MIQHHLLHIFLEEKWKGETCNIFTAIPYYWLYYRLRQYSRPAPIWLVVSLWQNCKWWLKTDRRIWFTAFDYIYFSKKVQRETHAIFLLLSPNFVSTTAYDNTRGLPLFGLLCLFGKTVSDEWNLIEESDLGPLITYICLRKSRGRHMQYFYCQALILYLLPLTTLLAACPYLACRVSLAKL